MTFIPIEGKSKSYQHSLIIFLTARTCTIVVDSNFTSTQHLTLHLKILTQSLSNNRIPIWQLPVICVPLKNSIYLCYIFTINSDIYILTQFRKKINKLCKLFSDCHLFLNLFKYFFNCILLPLSYVLFVF